MRCILAALAVALVLAMPASASWAQTLGVRFAIYANAYAIERGLPGRITGIHCVRHGAAAACLARVNFTNSHRVFCHLIVLDAHLMVLLQKRVSCVPKGAA